MSKKPKKLTVGTKIVAKDVICTGGDAFVLPNEKGVIYNVDDYPRFIYVDFEENKGVALSELEIRHKIEILEN